MNIHATPDTTALRLLDRGRDLLRDRRPADAALLLSRAASLPAAPAEAHGLLAEALMESDDAPAALIAADAALSLRDDAALRLLRARIRRALGHADGAMDDAAAAVMATPSDRDAKALLATCLSEAGRHDEAIFLFHQAFVAEPEAPHRSAMLAMAMMRGGRHAAAEELYALAHSMAPYARGILPLRAQNVLLGGDPHKAIALIEGALGRQQGEAALYSVLGQARQRLGQAEAAAEAYAEAARLDPTDTYLQHLAAAMTNAGATPDRASDRYVTDVFDGYANRFEAALFALGYRVPGVMLKLIEGQGYTPGGRHLGDVLDLGCGTGLMGATLHDMLGGRLVGVDLSPRMIEVARAKGIYTELRCAEINEAMAADTAHYDLVLLSDVLCYFGRLDAVLGAVAARLKPGGLVALSIESGEAEGGWELQASARYRHDPGYLRAALERAGLATLEFREETLRWEGEATVPGVIALARLGG
ncbi:methyltransferase domain-containing protein [Roseococcus thiosulfatophilus]|uniref:methyltransferase domain-containing protein n=1 Tax=Roseococcus thiosulfatophilus TaxID=35813 RepID=UPI001A8F4F9E|nr:methyltransferase domain-containing protein [Roseococcus thiosulfatophilus]